MVYYKLCEWCGRIAALPERGKNFVEINIMSIFVGFALCVCSGRCWLEHESDWIAPDGHTGILYSILCTFRCQWIKSPSGVHTTIRKIRCTRCNSISVMRSRSRAPFTFSRLTWLLVDDNRMRNERHRDTDRREFACQSEHFDNNLTPMKMVNQNNENHILFPVTPVQKTKSPSSLNGCHR